MAFLPCLAVGFLMNFVAVLFVLTCIALILIVLIQKGRGGGLSSAFGGGGSGGVLGTKTGDFLTWVTISLVSVFLILAVIMAKFYRPSTPLNAAQTQTVPADDNGTDALPLETQAAGTDAADTNQE